MNILEESLTKKEIRQRAKYLKSLSYKKVIKEIETPREVRFYLENCFRFGGDNAVWSFKFIHKSGHTRCLGYSITAAALLSDIYPPLILHIFFQFSATEPGEETHACYVYQNKKTGKWGCLGIPGENSRGAIFKDLITVCRFVEKNQRRMFPNIKCRGYTLHDFSNRNIIDSPRKIPESTWEYGPKWTMNGKKFFLFKRPTKR